MRESSRIDFMAVPSSMGVGGQRPAFSIGEGRPPNRRAEDLHYTGADKRAPVIAQEGA